MVSQPKDTPFGLEPNVAAGLAYLFTLIGGVVMLAGGGTNRFVKWAACQAITFFIVYVAVYIAIDMIGLVLHFLWALMGLISMVVGLLFFIGWLYLVITAFQGKEVRLPVIGDLTQQIFGSMLGAAPQP